MSTTEIRKTLKSWLEAGLKQDDIEMVLAATQREIDFANREISAAAQKSNFAARIKSMNASRFNEKELRLAMASCRRIGIEPDAFGRVSLVELNRRMKELALDCETRIRVKTELAHAKMID